MGYLVQLGRIQTNGTQSGDGQYDQEGKQKKIGRSIELEEWIDPNKYITYNGEDNMNGMKVGRWNIWFN
ncbi:unnamed protein product [Paramecium sonneborni]|uniref:Uncharacterized protein n=1 Tax=Paramecium sonneborni TaxID=65129 RepID=A0A8S1RSP3_9CILI|nr:unnamed protein product [Paramecium sonneborni]